MSSSVPPPDDRTTVHPASADERPTSVRPVPPAAPASGAGYDRQAVVARQKEEFGGMKFGATFFGWLAASGAAVLLTGLAAAVAAGLGRAQDVTLTPTSGQAATVGIVTGIVVLVIIFVAYYCGGYVAGRMARFHGIRQGIGVWLWAIIAAVVLAVLGLVAGNQFGNLSSLNAVPSIPTSAEAITATGILAALAVAVVALVGAILGGLAGMRFHRRVDRAGDGI